ncbi:Peptidoglycan synthase FtsI precursor [Marinobacterium sp. xm-d-579]|uniref:peptidoglycan D,D-transpeptidase FtsI family protein n=1 Tax=Marinobacterium sp. xm-d-579 TaxID=2497734 RepID=UPI0015685EB0|nr:penicillin-binding transpeptidase domain-containing protein [Marinobacterium sp. xm-d-579]NRP37111.1 Peptidoglycan synthase FtsI precursor [Marinobacterium sp. xm-d-579]
MSNEEVVQTQAAKGWRLWLVFIALVLISGVIVAKMVSLYTAEQAFLQKQGDARSLRTRLTPAHRGLITDRHGDPLAVSAPVATIWADPKETDLQNSNLPQLARLLSLNPQSLLNSLKENPSRRFMYLKRQVTPELAEHVNDLNIRGIHVDQTFRRFYPTGEVSTHLVGFTNVDGKGQEGFELAFDEMLHGEPGRALVLQDRKGRTIKHLKSLQEADPGEDLALSIDLRLQYLAYRELKDAVQTHKADSASAVILDARTGEVLALVNQPSYNPNDRRNLNPNGLRNRAVTDIFEPGSTMKPITVAAALMSGDYQFEDVIDTSPGYIRVRGSSIRDHRNYGELDMTGIITKSSNVGVVKLALSMESDAVRNLMFNMGLGQPTNTGFPGERSGVLPFLSERQEVERATLSYGYGLSVTPLQLAQSYIPFANRGVKLPISLYKLDEKPKGERVMPAEVATQVLGMMETVVTPIGTAKQAAVTGYRVGGKTGTAHKAVAGGYAEDAYASVFAGIAPISDPRIVMVVMVDNPKGQEYYGGAVAAPVFSRVMGGVLRLMNIPPDNWEEASMQVASK